MKLVAPDYYTKFRCIADKCAHSCCIGWEIDIDEDTLEYYSTVGGNFGERLKSNIVAEGETAHFCLGKDERCPFLNEKGLCDIIIELGPEALCQICDDHPRYRNFYSDREEIGVGLSCEAAAKLILSQREKTQLICLDDSTEEVLWDDEAMFIELRQKIWDIFQDRTKPFKNRAENVLKHCGLSETDKSSREWAEIYRKLERLDPVWDTMLDRLEKAEKESLVLPKDEWLETALEQLAVYFSYRHLSDSLEDDLFGARMLFVLQSVNMIKWMAALHFKEYGKIDIDAVAEIARIYSAEIEYSTENIEKLMDSFHVDF